jgi:ABC-type antimicrobial peptide transport system permease subunit
MLKLNIKIALRDILRNRFSSAINVSGLAIGLAACFMLLLYVSYEWNFDKQAAHAEDIYLSMTNVRDDSGKIVATFDGTTTAFGPLVKSGIPEVKYLARMNYGGKRLIANGEHTFKKTGKFADPEIMKMYDYEFIQGDASHAMAEPGSVILTESTAKVLFASTDVLNKSVRFEDAQDLKVTGVIRDLPENSSNRFDFLMPWSLLEQVDPGAKTLNWDSYSYVTLVRVDPAADIKLVNQKLNRLIKNHKQNAGEQAHFFYPLSKMHLYGKFQDGQAVGGAIEQIWLFMGLAFGILLIACVNFMNMATAKSERRAKEVGIKKTIGATKASLIAQFLIESVVLASISILIGLALVEAFLPSLNRLLQINMSISYFNGYSWLGLLGIVLLTGLVAGSYPAFYLSSFDPIQSLKGKKSSNSTFSVSLRQILVVCQFSFTIILIMATIVIYKQIEYIKNKPVGAKLAALVEMPQEGLLSEKYELLRSKLLNTGAVTSMCRSSQTVVHHGGFFNNLEWPGVTPAQRSILFNQVGTTYDFVKTIGLNLIMGRDFSEEHASDTAGVLVSANAVKTMDLKKPLGTVLRLGGQERAIIGVFQDYVWDSPYKSSAPLIVNFSKYEPGAITMRLNSAHPVQENLQTITRITQEINPAYPVELSFVDQIYDELLQKEQKLGVLSNVFGALAIFISCLGLYGLVAFSAAQRTKEFGIRKVLGASVLSLMQLLSVSFIKLICIANLIAIPMAYYLMGKWLQSFEFRTELSWWIIAVAAFGSLFVAMLTLSYQAYRTAVSHPVDALKYE